MSTIGLDAVLANQAATDAPKARGNSTVLGKEAFFNLLVKQLQYQDPLNPVENTEFTAQLAQFTTLETLSNIDENMKALSSLQASINNIQALSFIGRKVDAKGNVLRYTGENVALNFKLGSDAAALEVNIYNESGKLVRTIERTSVKAGDVSYTWDGRDGNGNIVPEGRYTFRVDAVDYEGRYVGSTCYAAGEVTGVRYDGGVTYLIIGNKEAALSDIEKIQG